MALTLPTAFLGRRGAKPRTRPHLQPASFTTAVARAAQPAVTAWRAARTTVLSLGAFSAFDYAMFQWHHIPGWLAVAGTLLAWEALGSTSEEAAR